MALSSYCNNNWGTTTTTTSATFESLNSEMMTNNNYFFSPQTELETELLGFCNGFFDDNNSLSNTFIDPFFSPNEFFYSDEYYCTPDHHLLTYDDPPVIFHSHEEFDPQPFPKRQKCYETPNNSAFTPDFFNNVYAPVSCPEPEKVSLPMPELIIAPEVVNFCGNFAETNSTTTNTSVKELSNNEQVSSSVSAQSMAARQRRRKITEKTQELGKLIPGGNKMNTAEMLQSAFKYVKYLQASVSILQSMGSFEENKVAEGSMEQLQVLLQSSIVQEKLYLEEKCLVPTEFVKVLAQHHDSKSEPSIRDDLNQLIQSENLGG